MSRSAIARIVPSSIGTSYVCPVRLSVIVSVSVAVATAPPSVARSSVPMDLPSRSRALATYPHYPDVRLRAPRRGLSGDLCGHHGATHQDGVHRHHGPAYPRDRREALVA